MRCRPRDFHPSDVVNAVNAQNLIVPSGTMKIDRFEYAIETNSAPCVVNDLNNLPIKAVNGAMIYIRDVAHVRDGNPPQTNIVRVNGKPRHADEHLEDRLVLPRWTSSPAFAKSWPTSRANCRRSCRSTRFPTSRFLCAAPSTAWFARQSSRPASPPS